MGELGAVVVFVSLRESCQAFVIGTHVKVMTAIFSAVSKGKKNTQDVELTYPASCSHISVNFTQ